MLSSKADSCSRYNDRQILLIWLESLKFSVYIFLFRVSTRTFSIVTASNDWLGHSNRSTRFSVFHWLHERILYLGLVSSYKSPVFIICIIFVLMVIIPFLILSPFVLHLDSRKRYVKCQSRIFGKHPKHAPVMFYSSFGDGMSCSWPDSLRAILSNYGGRQ